MANRIEERLEIRDLRISNLQSPISPKGVFING